MNKTLKTLAVTLLSVCTICLLAITGCNVGSSSVTYEGEWNLYQLVLDENSYTVGQDEDKFEADYEVSGELLATSYKLVLNEDGSATFTEEWEDYNCDWVKTENGVSLIIDKDTPEESTVELTYKNGILSVINPDSAVHLKKSS